MSVLVVADLHLDMWLQAGRDPFAALPPEFLASLEGLIVAGDLSNKPKVRWPHMIRHLARYIDPGHIHLLPGNHDYYNHILHGDERLAAICTDTGVNFVQKSVINIGNTRFLCCTLWTDFALRGDPARAMPAAQRVMKDYKYIRHGAADFRRIRPSDTAILHAAHRAWLQDRLSEPFTGRTIVVTHHCPHPELINRQRSDLDPVYGSNLLPMVDKFQPDAWLFGHTHWHVEATVGRTQVQNVSLGYPDQVSEGNEVAILLRGLLPEANP